MQLTIRDGTVALVRNGFVREPAELDALVEAAGRIVAGAAGDLRPVGAAARRSTSRCPPARWEDRESIPVTPFDMRTSPWWEAYRVAATDRDLALEDPEAYHRAFPANPVPGRAIAVLRGTGPDGQVFRLAFHTARQELAERGAVLFPAAGRRRLRGPGAAARRVLEMWFAEGGRRRGLLGPALDADRHRRSGHRGTRPAGRRPPPSELAQAPARPRAPAESRRENPCAR